MFYFITRKSQFRPRMFHIFSFIKTLARNVLLLGLMFYFVAPKCHFTRKHRQDSALRTRLLQTSQGGDVSRARPRSEVRRVSVYLLHAHVLIKAKTRTTGSTAGDQMRDAV